MTRTAAALLTAARALGVATASPAQTLVPNPSSDPVVNWYDASRAAVDIAKYPAAGNTQVTASRDWAIAWVAADNAIASLPEGLTPAGRDAATRAALSTAMFGALAQLVPQAVDVLREARKRTLVRIPGSKAKNVGKAAGRKAAAAELAARAGDGLDVAAVNAPFTPPPPDIGAWRPTPPAFASAVQAGQGSAKPFLIPDVATRFVAPAPAAID
jgi:hypothetical protein